MSKKKATNIHLEAEVLKQLKIKAAEENTSISGLIREAVSEVYGISAGSKAQKQDFKKDPFFKLIGLCSSGIKDGSVEHDRDIYGIRKR